MEEKRKEFRPKVLRRQVRVPHYDGGGIVAPQGGLFGDIAKQFTSTNGYNASLAPISQADYQPTMQTAQGNAIAGYGTFNQNVGDQQALAAALRGVVNGTGPNPAQAMLNNATGANVANQAALMAGQRGANANVGMMARQAAMAGSAAQQNAAGQAAQLQAQQSLGAMNQQGQVLNSIGNQNIAEQNANTNLFNSAAGANNAQNNSVIQNYANMQNLNQKTSQSNTDAVNKTEGGFLNGLGGLSSLIGLAKGGMVPAHLQHIHNCYYADGGEVPASTATSTATSTSTDTSTATQPAQTPVQERTRKSMERELGAWVMEGYADGGMFERHAPGPNPYMRQTGLISKKDTAGMAAIKSQEGPVSGDDDYQANMTPRQYDAQQVNASQPGPVQPLPGDVKSSASDYRSGGRVPGQARVSGDSLKNDTQPAMLSPGEIVLPRHITQSKDAPEMAKQFVMAVLKKQGHGNSNHYKEFHKALKSAILNRKTKSGA